MGNFGLAWDSGRGSFQALQGRFDIALCSANVRRQKRAGRIRVALEHCVQDAAMLAVLAVGRNSVARRKAPVPLAWSNRLAQTAFWRSDGQAASRLM